MTSFKLNTYLMCILLFIPGHIQANTLKAAVLKNENFQKRYNEVLGSLSPLEIENFKPTSDGSHLEIIEMIILQQALHLGGLKEPIIFEPHDMANLGEIAPIVDGTILMFGRSMWLQTSVDYQGSLYISEPVIKYGEFEAGLYYNIANKDLKDIKIDALSEFKIVANPRWLADWRALLNSPMTMVNFIGPWENMIAMLDANIVDLMLVNFSVSNDLNMIFKDKLYQPINNLKIVLPDSRHFVVSKRHPRGKEVFEALQKGLTIMQKLGKIRKLYEQAGVINSKVKNWDIINKQMLVL